MDDLAMGLAPDAPDKAAEPDSGAGSGGEAAGTFTKADVGALVASEAKKAAAAALDAYKRDEAPKVAEAAKSEAEKLAKMTAEQKAEYRREQEASAYAERIAELERREAEASRRELKSGAAGILAEKGLPSGLAEIADYSSADACSKSIAAIESVFRKAVEEGVNARLGGGAPKAGGAKAASDSEAAFFAAFGIKR